MATPLTVEFVGAFHPLPVRDRRLLLAELKVPSVDYRDDLQFYDWLAERYRTGEIATVDDALKRCSSKADERTSHRMLLRWLVDRTGRPLKPHGNSLEAIGELIGAALDLTDDTAIILAALAPNYDWLEAMIGSDEVADHLSDADGTIGRDDASDAPASPGAVDAAIDRLQAALDLLREAPQTDLLVQASGLADAIERHVGALGDRRRIEDLIARIAAGRDRLDPEERALSPALDSPSGSSQVLAEVLASLDAVEAALNTDADARASLARVISAPRATRQAAQRALDEAEERLEETRARLAEAAAAMMPPEGGAPRVADPSGGRSVDPEITVYENEPAQEEPTAPAAPTLHAPPSVLPAPIGIDGNDEAGSLDEAPGAMRHAEAETSSPDDGEQLQATSETFDAAALATDEPMPAEEPFAPDPSGNPAPRAAETKWNGWILTALVAGKAGLALHLADARTIAGADVGNGVAAVVIEALLHGRATQAAYDGAWSEYDALADDVLIAASSHPGGPAGRATKLLLFAGGLRPALLQSQRAWQILQDIEGQLAARLNPLVRTLGALVNAGIGSIAEIAAPPGAEVRRARDAELRREIGEWKTVARKRTTSFQRATLVWTQLVEEDGLIGRGVELVLARSPDARAHVGELVSRLADKDAVIDQVHDALSGRARNDPLVGGARKQLRYFISGAADLLGTWLRAQEDVHAGQGDRHQARRGELLRALHAARQAVPPNAEDEGIARAAAHMFDAVVGDLIAQIEGADRSASSFAPSFAEALDGELALLPAFPLNARRAIRMQPDDVADLSAAAELLETGVPEPAAAFDAALALDAASNADRLLALLPVERREGAGAALEHGVRQARERLADRARALRQRLDDLQIALTEADELPEDLERRMTAFEQAGIERLPLDSAEPGDLGDFPAAQRRLDDIDRGLEIARAPVAVRLEARIVEQERLGRDLAECRSLLRDGDLGTLTEEIGQVERHGIVRPREGSPIAQIEAFARWIDTVGDKASLPLGDLPRAARTGGVAGNIDFGALPDRERLRADALLLAWNALRRAVGPQSRGGDPLARLREALGELMAALGFTGTKVESAAREKAWFRLNVAVDPLRSRDLCLTPAFGSEAVRRGESAGRYAVCVVAAADIASCLSLFDTLPDRVLLFVTEPLTARQRRDFQRKARAGTRSVALADAMTIVALARTADAGTRAFFDVSIPYGSAQPYVDTGSQTSIEMFFGREKELKRLVDPQGACLVYGGRQLGKTALLKQIELKENGGADRVAIYCEIRSVGESVPAADVWRRIEVELRARKVAMPGDGAGVPERLAAWATAKPGRYLLILLDEADAFLEAEMAADFPVIGRMKGLMEDTGRAVKFVFAGLHNVQRFHRAPNSPLLHLGSSINVGPLLGSDREAARQMAFEPMGALGIAFDRPTDAYHMLSLVGFYPSLMQSFGKAVVQSVNEQLKRPGEMPTTPVKVSRKLIDECFGQQEFRDGVVERFQKTLQLDERYELITYAVWERTQQDSRAGRSTARGYPASAIRQMATEWWPAGFRDTASPDGFAAILDEMNEMGVLAREGERYALRSQRIAAMLGDEREIEDRLISFSERAPKRRPDPMTSHRRIGGSWSPLSIRQEATLSERLRANDGARLLLVGATPASGRDDLMDVLDTLAQDLRWPTPRRLTPQSTEVVLEVAGRERKDARSGAPKLILIDGAWPDADALHVLRRHRALRDGQHPVRLVYCGSPDADMLALPDEPDWLRLLLGPLPVETMFHWLSREQLPFADDEDVQRRLRSATGGFLQALEAIVLPQPERGEPDRLIARAAASSAKLSPADLGLSGPTEAFGRELANAAGVDPIDEEDLRDWAQAVDPERGAALLALLRALGIVEAVATGQSAVSYAFNPLAARMLA